MILAFKYRANLKIPLRRSNQGCGYCPLGLLCRRVQKSMFVCPWLAAGSLGRWLGHEIGTSSSIGPVFGPAGSTLNTLGVQKQDHFVLGGRMSSIWSILNYRVLTCVGHVWTFLDPSCTIVPKGPPLPCGCNLVTRLDPWGHARTIVHG